MTLVAHLTELRNRIAKALFFIAIGTVVGFLWYDNGLLTFLTQPYCAVPAHLRLDGSSGPMRRGVRAAGAVVQTRLALGPPPADPLVGRSPGNAHLRGHMRNRTTGVDAIDQQPPAEGSQPGITVGHEDLRAVQS